MLGPGSIALVAALLFSTMLAGVVVPPVLLKARDSQEIVIPASAVALDPSYTAPPAPPAPNAPPEVDKAEQLSESFASVKGFQLERFCRPFYIAGFNSHDIIETATVTLLDHDTLGGLSGRAIINQTFSQAAAMGINMIRTWAHTTTSQYEFQTAPGVYSPTGLEAMDFVLEAARAAGMQVILSFIDNWKYYNGVDQYVDWSPTVPPRGKENKRPVDKNGDFSPLDYATDAEKIYEVGRHGLFYTDPSTKKFYKDHVNFIINRNNSFNGRIYKDDPTIFAWNLINEPRCENWDGGAQTADCPQRVQKWIEEMAAYVKTLDTKHMVTIGSEGFFGEGQYKAANPAPWAYQMGQDFVLNAKVKDIDYMTLHSWPANWEIPPEQDKLFPGTWLNSHTKVARTIGKPVLFEEFGKKLESYTPALISSLRDPVFQATYAAVQSAIEEPSSITVGSMFWRWWMPVFESLIPEVYGVQLNDTTMYIIKEHSQYIRKRLNSVPSNPACNLGWGSWMPVVNSTTLKHACVDFPNVTTLYYARQALAGNTTTTGGVAATVPAPAELLSQFTPETVQLEDHLRKGDILIFPSHSLCCKAGLGGWEKGCD